MTTTCKEGFVMSGEREKMDTHINERMGNAQTILKSSSPLPSLDQHLKRNISAKQEQQTHRMEAYAMP